MPEPGKGDPPVFNISDLPDGSRDTMFYLDRHLARTDYILSGSAGSHSPKDAGGTFVYARGDTTLVIVISEPCQEEAK